MLRKKREFEEDVIQNIKICASSGVSFYLTSVFVQLAAYSLYSPASTLPGLVMNTVGLYACCLNSVIGSHIILQRKLPNEQIFGKNLFEQIISTTNTFIFGTFMYSLLGGSQYSFVPSDYCKIGSFARFRGMLPTGVDYADARTKGKIDMLGTLFGCHTCGEGKGTNLFSIRKNNNENITFIGDHQPPNKFVKEANAKFYRKYSPFGILLIKQHFYPQCQACSIIQSGAVRDSSKRSIFQRTYKIHVNQIRAYHFTGCFIGLWWYLYWRNEEI